MLCPKCYGSVNKSNGQCKHCGFHLKDMEGATNKKARWAFKNGLKEDVLYVTNLPTDVVYKKLLLTCIFLGLAGIHDLYVNKIKTFLCKIIIFVIELIVFMLTWIIGFETVLFNAIYSISSLFMGFNIIWWMVDLVKIPLRKYKVPVYKEEFSK